MKTWEEAHTWVDAQRVLSVGRCHTSSGLILGPSTHYDAQASNSFISPQHNTHTVCYHRFYHHWSHAKCSSSSSLIQLREWQGTGSGCHRGGNSPNNGLICYFGLGLYTSLHSMLGFENILWTTTTTTMHWNTLCITRQSDAQCISMHWNTLCITR